VPPTPLSHWIGFHLALLLLLAVEFVYARRQKRLGRDPHRTAIACTALWIAAALAFAVFLHQSLGPTASVQYLAGYVLEESMSVDNLFVFLLLFRLFQIDRAHQPKVLFWGVAGAMLMRGLFIAGGITLLNRFAGDQLCLRPHHPHRRRPPARSLRPKPSRRHAPLDRPAQALSSRQPPPGPLHRL
jgi:hypothetical protein